jgi:hypothetical protein
MRETDCAFFRQPLVFACNPQVFNNVDEIPAMVVLV